MDAVVWGTKHTMRDIGDLGLTICVELIDNVVAAGPETSNGFFQAYYLALLQDMFFVLTDADHKSGFKSTALVLARLFKLVETGDILVPLDPSAQSNPQFVAEYTANLLKSAFPHLQSAQVTQFVSALREQYGDFNKFRVTLRDFLSASPLSSFSPSAPSARSSRAGPLTHDSSSPCSCPARVPGRGGDRGVPGGARGGGGAQARGGASACRRRPRSLCVPSLAVSPSRAAADSACSRAVKPSEAMAGDDEEL